MLVKLSHEKKVVNYEMAPNLKKTFFLNNHLTTKTESKKSF